MGYAAEKLPAQEPEHDREVELEDKDLEEIEDMTDEVVAYELSDDMKMALAELERLSEDRGYELGKAETERLSEAADAEIKRIIASRHVSFEDAKMILEEKLGANRIPDMTDQAEFADPKEQAEYEKDKERMLQARKDIFLEKKAMEAVEELEAEEVAEKQEEPPKKKGFLARLFGKK